ncbi:hypothetical protein HPB50_022784 [Hyalomma asiaticum]|uniref:Uncharacterized protein n=1 Tax=Hyalomma asiaticum TaxID=266040 RepID=A0ACB7TPI5_HYAAI|nr:hypothetical protein HPB50_022784 [Hyalomma asiaticum]
MAVRAVLQGLPIEVFMRPLYDVLWERVAATLLGQKLSFYALLQDDNVVNMSSDDEGLVEELQGRLRHVEKACRRLVSAIIFSCCDKSYEARAVAPCFPYARCPLPRHFSEVQYLGLVSDLHLRVGIVRKSRHRISASMVLVRRAHSSGNVRVEPMASRERASLVGVKRRRCSRGSRKVAYRHPHGPASTFCSLCEQRVQEENV